MVSAADVVPDTLRRLAVLEYRGYDSYGIAVAVDEGLVISKDVGSVGAARAAGAFEGLPASSLAIAHTRWATHGGVSVENAHPHVTRGGQVAVVHNGVIENHADLRRSLRAQGVEFVSETDTEVIAHLVGLHLDSGLDVLGALARAADELVGEYALGVVVASEPDVLYGAKRKSPLLVAFDGQQAVMASDQMATAGVGDQLIYLEDGDILRLTPGGAEIFRAADGRFVPQLREPVTAPVQSQAVGKGGFDHYMLKEIHEVPEAVLAALEIPSERFEAVVPVDEAGRLALVGSGSSYYVAQIAQYAFMKVAGVTASAFPSDEALHLADFRRGDSLIAVSQSGETFDTLEVCRAAVASGAELTSISNVAQSTQERLAARCFQQGIGPEVCVLSTKSIVSQLMILFRLAVEHGWKSGRLSDAERAGHQASLERLPETLRQMVSNPQAIRELAAKYNGVEHWFFVGRGLLYPAALESALKFKEVSYHHAEGMAAGFFKHGTISLIEPGFFTVALLPSPGTDPELYRATLANVSEIAARSGPVIGFGPDNASEDDLANFVEYVRLPYHDDDLANVIIQLVAGQLFAYYCAVELGREIDQPRSLAKSVTVR